MRCLVVIGWLSLSLAARQQQPTDNDLLAERAVDAERRNDFTSAVNAFQQLLKNGVDSRELRSNLGIAYFQLGKYGDALNQFRRVLGSDGSSFPANLFSGLSLLKMQRHKESLLFLRKAQAAQPDNPDVLIAIAQANVATGALPQASSLYQRVTLLRPEDAYAWYGLGITDRALAEQTLKSSNGYARQQAQRLMDTANAAFARAVQLDPNSVNAYMILGESFRIAEQYEHAVEEYKMATGRKPEFAPAWAGLAQAYSAAGRDEDALNAAHHALALDPNDAGTHVLIAATHLQLGDLLHAKEFVRQAIELQPGLSSAHIVLAKIDLQEQQPEKALSELNAAVKDDIDGSTNYLLATTLRQLGKTTEAAAAMQNYKRLHAMHVAPNGGAH